MLKKHVLTIVTLFMMVVAGCDSKENSDKTTNTSELPPNIIMLIGDGMGVPQISTAYYFGDQEANFSKFRHIGFHKTSDISHKITDSAAGATAFSTGEKTYKRAIGVSADSAPRKTILEFLKEQGYKTGLLSLTTITHATPASFYAHVPDRDMHEEIAAQLVQAQVDFVAGGGRNFFGKRQDGKDLYKALLDQGYKLDTTQLSDPDPDRPNMYLLADESMPSKVEGRKDFLPQATKKALDYLSASKEPFFMMTEASYIDWGGHDMNDEMVIAEVEDMDKTLGVILEFMESNPNTLLVVTADHETGGVSIGKFYETDPATGKRREVPDKVQVYFNSDQHSGELIPVFAMGPGAEKFQGIYENNEIFHKMMEVYNESK